MKKLLIVLSLFVCFVICGCGNKTNTTEEENGEDVVYEKKSFQATDEIMNAELGSGLIQIGDSVVRFPTQVYDLTQKTNASYFSIGYDPNIMSNEALLSGADEGVIAGLYFSSAECTVEYCASVPNVGTCTAGELYTDELREIESENIILPKGIKVGMTFQEIKDIFGDSLTIGYNDDENTMEYKVRFLITDVDAVQACNESNNFSNPDGELSSEYVGFLYMEVDRNTGVVRELSISYGYDASYN